MRNFLQNTFSAQAMFGLISPKRILVPFSVIKFKAPSNRPDFICVYIFGIRVAYFTA